MQQKNVLVLEGSCGSHQFPKAQWVGMLSHMQLFGYVSGPECCSRPALFASLRWWSLQQGRHWVSIPASSYGSQGHLLIFLSSCPDYLLPPPLEQVLHFSFDDFQISILLHGMTLSTPTNNFFSAWQALLKKTSIFFRPRVSLIKRDRRLYYSCHPQAPQGISLFCFKLKSQKSCSSDSRLHFGGWQPRRTAAIHIRISWRNIKTSNWRKLIQWDQLVPSKL